ncbi:MAG: hypothetical protein JNL63_03590 [Bacteroidia bacterium]|nr:hypothetical protein [Bacteroidia bacterium]
MRNALVYLLILIVSIACCYETIQCFSEIIADARFTLIDDFQGEEKNTESENSNEKNENADISDDFYHNVYANDLTSAQIELKGLRAECNKTFSPSDHSKEIYSPPEAL